MKKERIGSKTKKIHDKAKTPYQRILERENVPEEVKNKLKEQYKTLNLVMLKREIDLILKRLQPTPIR